MSTNMDNNAWIERWQADRIGFHRDDVNPHLVAMAASLPAAGARVLVPLCGKTVDMVYLAAAGYRVLGVELSAIATEAFFAEAGLSPERVAHGPFTRWSAGSIEILQGDLFELDKVTAGSVDAVWDRAALIALPPSLRARYVRALGARLSTAAPYLLLTMEVPGREVGPPYSVDGSLVRSLYADHFDVEVLGLVEIDASDDRFGGGHEGRYVMRKR